MKGRLWLISLLFTLPACSHSGTVSQQQVVAPPAITPAQEQEIPFDYASLKEDVLIQLDEEPRLHSPISTVVSPKAQGYTFFFRESMNRSTVEHALLKQAEARATDAYITPKFNFQWKNDRELHAIVSTAAGNVPDYGQRRYLLDVKGASTKSGKELKEPPQFTSTLYTPTQLWRMSLDGTRREQLSSFTQPYYTMQFLGEDQRYLLLSRFGVYCECDADHERLYALYDTKEKKHLSYPLKLSTNYLGKGEFVADRRGFFYAKPEPKLSLPASDSAVPVQLDQYVHGASFSDDRRYIFLASGKEEQQADFDLIIIDLDTGKKQQFAKALQGRPEQNQLTGANMPISFIDDGKQVTAALWDKTAYKPKYIQYTWATGKIAVSRPVLPDGVSLYSQSSDGLYKVFTNGVLYKGSKQIANPIPFGQWINGTHTMVYTDYDNNSAGDSRYKLQLKRLDADSNTTQLIAAKLGVEVQLLGITPDGQWIYLQSNDDLN